MVENRSSVGAPVILLLILVSLSTNGLLAHCDTMNGPVVKAARVALETGNVHRVLIWVRKTDEAEVKDAFEKTQAVRKLGGTAKELAERYFFETVVRLHRTGEGAPYTGLKPATEPAPPIVVSEDAIATGTTEVLMKHLSIALDEGVHKHFQEVMSRKQYDQNDVDAGRAFVAAYVAFVHYVEHLFAAVHGTAAHSGEGSGGAEQKHR